MNRETLAIRLQSQKSSYGEHSVPLYLTSSFVFDDAEDMRAQFAEEKEGQIYSRYANPNVEELLQKMATLEGTEAGWATATGMAAVFTTFAALLQQNDHIVASRSVFGSTHKVLTELLPKWGITTTYVDVNDYEGYEQAIGATTKMVYVETPSNPGLDIIDLERLSAICRQKKVLLVVDNCFATPVIQRPVESGADIVIHSATKYLDGQGRTMGGIILASKSIIDQIKAFARHSGPALSPFNAWILSKSLETLFIRVERHAQSALEIARRLEQHPAVASVRYPFLESHPGYAIARKQMSLGGGIVSFEINGGIEAGKKFLDALQLFSLSANLGDTRSIATHPASTTHSKLTPEQRLESGITDGLIRLSIGLEHVEDIWEDVLKGLS
ncbi:aminotransferase class I/II-fold pyridoxal phosphate-dependent enzyme [Crocinitomicaceae bacterium CZZ-1]|uniref:O-succinylhomoserine sulfhydrylase n=1 Tax=Taishania pollutisoli TaxID=2766479 RepID=A0A8J6TST5_9FLAO|nr:aminotransferase class I/II-fold pyridoxal phosphate-dependent enzyme [Taishania pollutisoli]MBC9811664.1 aminotransferase class I/II-fold pyridoxal phosphate-dependent enzyme [Taishania pollutisoli]